MLAALGLMLGVSGCHTIITPLQPAAIGAPWALPPVRPAPVRPAAARRVAVSPHWFANTRNASMRLVRIANYGHIWRQSIALLRRMGYRINWSNYRLGVITTYPRMGPELLQWWRPDATTGASLLESTLNTYRRTVRLVITHAAHSDTFMITVEVLVEQRENPTGEVGNMAFYGPSAFGGNALTLQSSHAPLNAGKQYWMTIGRDPLLEKKILAALGKRI